MKNEWNLFADVLRALAAGQPVVSFLLVHPSVRPEDGSYGVCYSEEGTEYQAGEEFMQALIICIIDQRVACSMKRESELQSRYRFGPGLEFSPVPSLPPGKYIDLMAPETDFAVLFPSDDKDDWEDGDEWKALLK